MQQLNPQQQEAVNTTKGPVLILAGAGSGKTKVLTHRIAHLLNQGVNPNKILAITFTNKAAKEMRTRVDKLSGETASEVWLYTFHAFCARFLRSEIDNLQGYHKNFTIYDSEDSKNVIKDIIKKSNLDKEQFNPTSIQNNISSAKNKLIWPEQYRYYDPGNPYIETVAKIYDEYNKTMKKNNAVDFDDLILLTLKIFEQKEYLREKYQDKFEYIMVDEYQDVNSVQYKLTKILANKHHNLCVVGDADQSIYSWRGADIKNILSFEKDYPEAKIIKLEQNYRSTREILEAANTVILNNQQRKEKKLWTNQTGNKLYVYQAEDQEKEAKFISNLIRNLVSKNKVNLDDIAILYRNNIQSKPIEQELLNQGLEYQIIGGLKLNERKEIKDILAYLSVLNNPNDNIHLSRIINVPKRGIGNTTISKMESHAELHDINLFDIISSYDEIPEIKLNTKQKEELEKLTILIFELMNETNGSVKSLINHILESTGYMKELIEDKKPETKQRIEHINELIKVAEEFDNSTDEPTLEKFLEETALVTAGDEASDGTVTLMTLHSAKGLEFPIVFLSGMNEGIFPSEQANTNPDEMEEERRLCYVGITRAKNLLILTNAKERMVYGTTKLYEPSRFIHEIPNNLLQYISA